MPAFSGCMDAVLRTSLILSSTGNQKSYPVTLKVSKFRKLSGVFAKFQELADTWTWDLGPGTWDLADTHRPQAGARAFVQYTFDRSFDSSAATLPQPPECD